MNPKNTSLLIVNPAAGGIQSKGKLIALQQSLQQAFGEQLTISITKGPGEATQLARQAIQSGVQAVFAAGGDGTINEVINGFFDQEKLLNPDCQLGILNFGTGQGFAQSLGLPTALEDQITLLKQEAFGLIDVAQIEYLGPNGSTAFRYFINECNLGIGAQVVAKVKQTHKRFGGRLAFGLVTLQEGLSAPAHSLQLRMNANPAESHTLLGLVISNGPKMAGGMQLSPAAQLNDRKLDLLLIKHMPFLQRLYQFPKIYSGKHLESDKFELREMTSLEVNATGSVMVEADGELLGSLPVKIKLMPQQIPIKTKSLRL